jgi:hypothetical protein
MTECSCFLVHLQKVRVIGQSSLDHRHIATSTEGSTFAGQNHHTNPRIKIENWPY